MAKTTNTNSVEQTATVVGKAVTERLSTQLTGVHATFSLLLDEIKTNNKISNGLTLGQLKYERDIDKDINKDAVKNEDQNNKIIKGLKDLNDTLKSIKKSSTGTPISGKESAVSAGLPKAATNLTLTEKLKSVVGGVKSAGNKFAKVSGSIVDTLGDPEAAIKKAYGSSKGVIKGALGTAKDILSTKADYSVEQERFATAFSKTGRGGLMQGKKTGKEVGAEAFNKLKAKQEEVEQQKAVLKPFEEQGFAPAGEKKKLAKLQKELADMDPRIQKDEKEKESTKKDKIESKVSSKAEQDPSSVTTATGSEDLLKEIKANSVTLGSLLSVGQAQLLSINAVKEALAPTTPKEIVEQKSAPSAEAAAPAEGKSLGDAASEALSMIPGGGGKDKPGKKGIGGRILSSVGKAARFLGPAAAIAGAAYSGVSGYQNTNENFDVEEGKEATTGQKVASTLGGVASGLTFGLLDEKSASQGIHKAGSAVKDFFGFGEKKKPETTIPTPVPITSSESKTRIAGEEVGEKLSDKQMAVMEMSKASGNKYSPEIEAKYADQRKSAGSEVAKTSTENADMSREASTSGGGNNTVVSNNVNNAGTTKFVPMKAAPRPEYTGSALDRYTSRIAVY
jgi:hypothetical protein